MNNLWLILITFTLTLSLPTFNSNKVSNFSLSNVIVFLNSPQPKV